MTGFYILMGVLAALLALFAILLVVFRNKERIQNPRSADAELLIVKKHQY